MMSSKQTRQLLMGGALAVLVYIAYTRFVR
jgi:hypothetical protein